VYSHRASDCHSHRLTFVAADKKYRYRFAASWLASGSVGALASTGGEPRRVFPAALFFDQWILTCPAGQTGNPFATLQCSNRVIAAVVRRGGKQVSLFGCGFLPAMRGMSAPHVLAPAIGRNDDVTYVPSGENAFFVLSWASPLSSLIAKRVRRLSTRTYSIRLVFLCTPLLHSSHKTSRRCQ
jgi:hypothetical protein